MFFPDMDVGQGSTGCLLRSSKCGANPLFPMAGGEACPIIPRGEWQECSISDKVWTVINQNPQNSCCPSATAGATMILRQIGGQRQILLSQGSLYGRINGGRDQGANIEDALTAMMAVGICPADVIKPQDYNQRSWPKSWADVAKRFRILEAFDCPTFDAMASAVQRRIPVVFGVYWGSGGHAICATGLKKFNGDWVVEFLNSWGSSWGDNGIGVLTEKQCRGIEQFGAFAIRSVTLPSDEVIPPMPIDNE